MVATSEDVARRAGVSRATVSQILNGRGARFAADTIAKVQQAAEDLRYQPSAAGRTLAMGSSDFVIALVPNTTFGGNLQDIFESATEELASRGLTLVLRLSSSTSSLEKVLAGMKPRAIFTLATFTAEERAIIQAQGVRAFDATPSDLQSDFNRDIGRLQARYLVERGYTRLAFAHLQDARQDPYGYGREAGVNDICIENGLRAPEIIRLGIDMADGLAAVDSLALPGVAVACYNDDVATTLLSAARIRGWRVPEDLAIIGMDHTPLSSVTVPPLTTVSIDFQSAATNIMNVVLMSLGEEPTAPALEELNLHIVAGGTV